MSMQWEKPSESVVEAFQAALPDDPAVQRKKMFGFPAAFVNGNMFAGVWQTSVMLRLPEAKRTEIIAAGQAEIFAPMGRTSREYVLLTPAAVTEVATLSHWLDEALRFGASMPVKEPKPRRKKMAP